VADSTLSAIEQLEWSVWPAFAMLAGARLELFTHLKDGPKDCPEIARALGVRADKLKPLLLALAAIGLLTIDGDNFANSKDAARLFVRGSPAYRDRTELWFGNWQAGLRTAETIRRGEPQGGRDFSTASRETLEIFYRAHYGQALSRGRELASLVDFRPHQTVLDVGGGSGGLSVALTEAFPKLAATIVDLPSVTPITEILLAEAGAPARVRVITADMLSDTPAESFDAAVVSSVVQVLSSDDARRLLADVGRAIRRGGSIYLRGDVLDDSGVTPFMTVMRNLVYLNVYSEGQAYTEREHREWLAAAGFENVTRRILPDGFSLLQGQKM
jgi:2-hydroxy-4-(methylsulfanyl)butanoate S-methyltransferase